MAVAALGLLVCADAALGLLAESEAALAGRPLLKLLPKPAPKAEDAEPLRARMEKAIADADAARDADRGVAAVTGDDDSDDADDADAAPRECTLALAGETGEAGSRARIRVATPVAAATAAGTAEPPV